MKKLFLLFSFLYFASDVFGQKVEVIDGRLHRSNEVRKEAYDGYGLRAKRRVGIGGSFSGSLGFGGFGLEMNIKPEWSLGVGYGGGPGYTAFSVEYKKYVSGKNFLPYLGLGFSRWYGAENSVNPDDTNPGFLGTKFLKGSDKANGRVNEFLFYPKLGIQYLNLAGEWAGYALHADVVLLIDPLDMVMAPTASFGATYYF